VPARVNVIAGDNGQGKTSLLEALYFAATSKSYRETRLSELVQQGQEVASVRATLREAGHAREQRAAISGGTRSLSVDGKRPPRLASYAIATPVVVFHPGDLELASGPAAPRRLLLDRLALFIEPASADHRQRYERALRGRQRALEDRGPMAAELDAYEALMAEHGAAVARARAVAAERLIAELEPAFGRVAATGLELRVHYLPGGSTDAGEFLSELAKRRGADQRRKAATFGPQRDELELELDRRSARRHASQGQQRILTLALKLSELACIREARGAHPVLLLDDVSSELDPARTGAVYELLRDSESQVFITTTRPELLLTSGLHADERADFTVVLGQLERVRRAGDLEA